MCVKHKRNSKKLLYSCDFGPNGYGSKTLDTTQEFKQKTAYMKFNQPFNQSNIITSNHLEVI